MHIKTVLLATTLLLLVSEQTVSQDVSPNDRQCIDNPTGTVSLNVDVRGISGPQGPRGEQGLKGSIGESGSKGVPGLKGDRGLPGDTGPIGTTGIKGEQEAKARKDLVVFEAPVVPLVDQVFLVPKASKENQGTLY